MQKNNLISFCIPTHNNLEYLKLCIQSIRTNAVYKDSPIIVYAEGCSDGTNEWLLVQPDIESYIYPDDNWDINFWGIGGGMNFCATKVKTPYIFFLHSDMYISPGADEALLMKLNNCHHTDSCVVSAHRIEPDVWGVGVKDGIVELRAGTLMAPKDYLGHVHSDFNVDGFNQIAEQFTKENKFVIRKGEGAGGFMISKKAWDHIGGNDPTFAPKSFEDMDLFIRMQLEGYHFVLIPDALIWHFGARSSHFPTDDFSKKSINQSESEKKNSVLWRLKWQQDVKFDEKGFVIANGYERRYEELKEKNKHIHFNG